MMNFKFGIYDSRWVFCYSIIVSLILILNIIAVPIDIAPTDFAISGSGEWNQLITYNTNSNTEPYHNTRGTESVSDFKLKWLDGYGTMIGYLNSIKSADVDGDGEMEIVFGNSEGYVYVVGDSPSGYVEEWKTMVGMYAFGLTIDDVDKDGNLEIITGYSEGYINIFGWDGSNYALEWTSPDLGSDLYGLTTADIDGDGTIEIIAGTSVAEILTDNLFVYKWDGSTYQEEWSYALTATLGYLGMFNIDCGDVDDDGDWEIVVATYENEMVQNDPPVNPIPPNPRPQSGFGGRFYVFSNTGGLPEYQSDDFGDWIMGMSIDDTDVDDPLEIVLNTYFGDVYVFTYGGSLVYIQEWRSTDLSAYTLTLGRIADSEFSHIIFASWDYLYVYEFQGGNYNEVWASP